MSLTNALRGKAKTQASISVTVTRADGRVDDYGVVASNSLWFRIVGRHLARHRINKLNRRV